MVSILLAARNEESTIERCLLAFTKLDYPVDKLEILIGDDASDDRTRELAQGFFMKYPHMQWYAIDRTIGKSSGKANVLAQLAQKAKGDYFFITDCDVAVPKHWITSMLTYFTTEVGICSGTTTCKQGNFFANLQRVDWLHFMGYIKAFANVGISCTSVGNNMAVRATAYRQTGGYENMNFSITEDYKLFKEVTSLGWQWRNSLEASTLGSATYIDSLRELMHQRKRWLMGAAELPIKWKLMIVLYGLFLPALFAVLFINIHWFLLVWFSKNFIQTLFLIVLFKKSDEKSPHLFFMVFFYEIYLWFITVSSALFYVWPSKSVWKGRRYSSKGLVSID